MPSIKLHRWLFASVLVALVSCNHNRLDVDVSDIKIAPVKIQRFDQAFFSINIDNINKKLPELQAQYPDFADLFIRNILCPGGASDNACIPEIARFVADKDMRGAFDDCQKTFPDMNDLEAQLTDVFLHYKYYYPQAKIPNVIAMMSGFNYAIESHDTTISIGLEMYLGSKTPFYEMLQIPKYKRVNMHKEFIVPNLIQAWMGKGYPNNNKSGTLLNEMIYQGKLLYLMDALMPQAPDSIKIGFSKSQLDWCVENENNMWGYLIKNKFLYSSEITTVTKFTGDAPFTTGFVKESPGRTGVWIGWHIVRKYMDNNPEITIDQLMIENDPQKILSHSKYKP